MKAINPRTFTVESPVEITFKEGVVPTVGQVLRATMHLAPDEVFVCELSDDPQRAADFLASVESQTTTPE